MSNQIANPGKMGDYISRQWLLAEYDKRHEGPPGGARKLIEEAPPVVDVRPVVRGEWKRAYTDHEAFGVRPFYRYCSECNESTVFPYNFCPHCGADMRPAGEEANND